MGRQGKGPQGEEAPERGRDDAIGSDPPDRAGGDPGTGGHGAVPPAGQGAPGTGPRDRDDDGPPEGARARPIPRQPRAHPPPRAGKGSGGPPDALHDPAAVWARITDERVGDLLGLLEELPLMVFMKGTDGRYIAANRAFAELVCRPVADIPGTKAHDLFSRDVADKLRAQDELVVKEGRASVTSVEDILSRGGSHVVMFKKAPMRDRGGSVVGVMGVGIDFTSRMKAASALQEREEQFHNLVDVAFDGFLVTDGERVLDANERAAGLFLYGLPELIGRPIRDLVATEDHSRLGEGLMGEAKPNLQLRGLRRDGTGMDLEASCGEVRFRGTPARIIGVRDITERRRMEELLKAQHGLSLVLSETVELGETMFIGMKTAMAVSEMDAGAIFLLDKETGEYGLTYHEGFDFALLQHPPWPVPTAQEPASGWSDAPLYLSPKDLDRADAEVCARSGIRSLAVLPVRHGGEVVAYIVMASRAAGEVPKAARLALKIVSDQIGVFILRVTREDAHRDAEDRFTRLFNLGPAPTVILSVVVSTDGSPVDFVVVDLNPAFEALTGARYTSSGGKLLSGLLPRDATAGPALKALLAMSKGRSPSIQHMDVSWLGGKVVVTMVPLMKGEVGGIVERET